MQIRKVPLLYILTDDGHPVPAKDFFQWDEWMKKAAGDGRRVVATNNLDGTKLVTIFTGINRNTQKGPPQGLFESFLYAPAASPTPIIGPWRYDTWSNADYNHHVMMARLRSETATERDESHEVTGS